MKATGIVRRIDDLGRVVIPKEIRRTMRIREGDPLEIFTAPNGEVIFKKYSPIGELSETAHQYAEVLHRATDLPVIMTDRDHVIAVSGAPRRELVDRRVSEALESLMTERRNYTASPDRPPLHPVTGYAREAAVAFPIIGGVYPSIGAAPLPSVATLWGWLAPKAACDAKINAINIFFIITSP